MLWYWYFIISGNSSRWKKCIFLTQFGYTSTFNFHNFRNKLNSIELRGCQKITMIVFPGAVHVWIYFCGGNLSVLCPGSSRSSWEFLSPCLKKDDLCCRSSFILQLRHAHNSRYLWAEGSSRKKGWRPQKYIKNVPQNHPIRTSWWN